MFLVLAEQTMGLLEDEELITSESRSGRKLFMLTEAGRREAEAGPQAPWEEAGRGADWEAMNEAREAADALLEAFRQACATGTAEQREKAIALVNDTRKRLYLILADSD